MCPAHHTAREYQFAHAMKAHMEGLPKVLNFQVYLDIISSSM